MFRRPLRPLWLLCPREQVREVTSPSAFPGPLVLSAVLAPALRRSHTHTCSAPRPYTGWPGPPSGRQGRSGRRGKHTPLCRGPGTCWALHPHSPPVREAVSFARDPGGNQAPREKDGCHVHTAGCWWSWDLNLRLLTPSPVLLLRHSGSQPWVPGSLEVPEGSDKGLI